MRAADSPAAQNKTYKDEWLTPPHVLDSLGPFALDPCSPIVRPWPTADRHFTVEDNGLEQQWKGSVWLNPPYGNEMWKWLDMLALHGNGIALIFARTETKGFTRCVWQSASAVFFLRGRLKFHHVSGKGAGSCAGAPSVLVSYGEECSERLRDCGLDGKFIPLA